VVDLLRPWLAVLALLGSVFIALVFFAWSVDLSAPAVVNGVAEGAASVRLRGIGMGLHREVAEMRRAEVRRLRRAGAPAAVRASARHALADQLRDGALLADAQDDSALAEGWMAEAAQAAPERVDLLCLLTELRTRETTPEQRRMAFLRLVYEHDAPCACVLAGESFLEAGDSEAARAYLERAIEHAPRWAEPRLLLARLDLRTGDVQSARVHAGHALAVATDLPSELQATALLRSVGGAAPARWLLIGQWAWRRYAYLLPSLGIFVVLLLSPMLLRLVRRGVAAVRSQRGMAESAS
jgi:tetratricopeptide (TPR) repeat protein